MENLENLNLTELKEAELRDVEGGFFGCLIVGLAAGYIAVGVFLELFDL